jgi:hypothetical protein
LTNGSWTAAACKQLALRGGRLRRLVTRRCSSKLHSSRPRS